MLFWTLAIVLSASGAGDRAAAYDIPTAPAAVALREYARQSGVQLVFTAEAVRGVTTNAVRGEMSAADALARLLDDTGLVARQEGEADAIAVLQRPRRPLHPATESGREEVHYLNPFEVRADADHGYGALQSGALTAFRADLRRLPVTAEIFTQTFMEDVAADSVERVIVNYSGAAGFVGSPINVAPGDREGFGGLSLRGMSVAGIKRDGFIGVRPDVRNFSGSTDNYATERIELLEGPQSLLYGGSGGGGIVNLVSKQARFLDRQGEVRFSFDQDGSKRALLDLNAGGRRFAVRFAGVEQRDQFRRQNLGGRFSGLYLQAAWQIADGTTLRLWGEHNDREMMQAFKPVLDSLLAPEDPRQGLDARYLAYTGQLGDIAIGRGLDELNVDSLAGWWSSERIGNDFAGLSLETRLGARWVAQFAVVYGETGDARINPLRRLLPAFAGGNPFGEVAMAVVPGDNQQPHRTRGVRATFVTDGDHWGGRVRSQTALGLEAVHNTDVDSIDYAYYEADAGWNVRVDPALPAEYGRTRLGALFFPLGAGPVARPLFRPGADRVTVEGRNYVRQPRIRRDPALASPGNPLGLVPNNPGMGNGFAGNFSHADTHSRAVFAASLLDWFDGRFTTLTGVRFSQSNVLNAGPGGISYRPPWDEDLTGNLGVVVPVARDLRAFAALSTSYIPLQAQTRNLLGERLQPIRAGSLLPEVGLKFSDPAERFLATFSYHFATTQRNEAAVVDISYLDAVNPAGLNGRYGAPDQWVNLDRRSRGFTVKLTAAPTRAWRLRLSLGATDGETVSDVRFAQLYNDQFHTRGGVVTYADGTPVLVDPAGSGGPGLLPLTLAMLNDPASPFHAQPDPDSGRITGALALAALARIDPHHGAVATGTAGLPLSAIQYRWDDPRGHRDVIGVFATGQKSTGYNEYNLNFQVHHTFTEGRLRGLAVFADGRTYWRNRAYYVQAAEPGERAVNGAQYLYRLPSVTALDLGLAYARDLRPGIRWSVRLNVQNVLNHHRVWTVPNPVGGAFTQVRRSQQPRRVVWTTALEW